MRTTLSLALALAVGITLASQAVRAAPTPYAAAVAETGRPDSATKLDADRKPAEVLAFLGLKPGMDAADIMSGSGYWAEIMAGVVGPTGHVAAYEPDQFMEPDGAAKWRQLTARRPNVGFTPYPFEAFAAAPDSFDFAIISLNYHDLYWTSEKYHIPRTDPAAFVHTLYAAMKPGGVVGIVDHVGPAGDTRAIVDKMHRIDPATVKADFEAAGFKLAAESPILRNPADDHTKSVFDASVRGRTDRFLFRFVKPR